MDTGIEVQILDDVVDASAGTVVMVDVIRAFTTAAMALAAGADRVMCARDIDVASSLATEITPVLLAGEQDGLRPDGFDAPNSPVEMTRRHLAGTTLVLATKNGTAVLARADKARTLLAAGAVNLSATAAWITRFRPRDPVWIVCTDDTGEDRACADHLALALDGGSPSAPVTRDRILSAAVAHEAQWARFHATAAVERFRQDVQMCALVDIVDFAMTGRRARAAVQLVASKAGT